MLLIATRLTAAGYLVKEKDGRRNRYEIQEHLPLPESTSRELTIGEVLELLRAMDPTQRRGELRSPGE